MESESIKLAYSNFPFSVPSVSYELLKAIISIKKAAALANYDGKKVDEPTKSAIVSACDKLLGSDLSKFASLPSIQGGAGTLINMAVNEMIANKANGNDSLRIHPIDDVNKSQSTNDVNPSALRIAAIRQTLNLIEEIKNLEGSLEKLSKKYDSKLKLGRTHLQDAVLMFVSEEFLSWKEIMVARRENIKKALDEMYFLNLGGTAIGNSINAPEKYIERIYIHLSKETGLNLKKSKNFMAQTQSSVDFFVLHSTVLALYIDLSKIAKDLRILSSGPKGGIGEVNLPPLQKGSSIMPGKVNPVIPESINQIYYLVSANNQIIEQSSRDSELQLSVMFPSISYALLSSLTLSQQGVKNLRINCIDALEVNIQKCRENLNNSSAMATLLTQYIGYEKTSELVKNWSTQDQNFKDFIKSQGILTKDRFKKVFGE